MSTPLPQLPALWLRRLQALMENNSWSRHLKSLSVWIKSCGVQMLAFGLEYALLYLEKWSRHSWTWSKCLGCFLKSPNLQFWGYETRPEIYSTISKCLSYFWKIGNMPIWVKRNDCFQNHRINDRINSHTQVRSDCFSWVSCSVVSSDEQSERVGALLQLQNPI